MQKYIITARKPKAIQYNVQHVTKAALPARLIELTADGYLIEKVERAEQPKEEFVRFGSDGQRVQYEDAADASEHRLRMAEGLC